MNRTNAVLVRTLHEPTVSRSSQSVHKKNKTQSQATTKLPCPIQRAPATCCFLARRRRANTGACVPCFGRRRREKIAALASYARESGDQGSQTPGNSQMDEHRHTKRQRRTGRQNEGPHSRQTPHTNARTHAAVCALFWSPEARKNCC